jgi:VWFA-related protein
MDRGYRKTIRNLGMVALAGLACLPCGFPQAPGEDSEATIRTTAELVTVGVQVLHKKTETTVEQLQQQDFHAYEDGVEQKIRFFSQDTLPLSVVFLFDLTDSVRPVLKPLAERARDALGHLKPEDEAAVMVYAASANLLEDFTTDRDRTVAAIRKASTMKSREAAFFNEGVFQAAARLSKAKNPASRRVIIWLTDNVPNIPSESVRRTVGTSVPRGSLHTEEDAFRELFETGTVVSALLEHSALSDLSVMLGNNNPVMTLFRLQNPPGDVFKYADRTGGQVMKSDRKQVSRKLAELIDQIRTRYSLGYAPSLKKPPGTFCKIRVAMNPEVEKREGRLLVRAKQGYYRQESARLARPGEP